MKSTITTMVNRLLGIADLCSLHSFDASPSVYIKKTVYQRTPIDNRIEKTSANRVTKVEILSLRSDKSCTCGSRE